MKIMNKDSNRMQIFTLSKIRAKKNWKILKTKIMVELDRIKIK